ncbi:phage tail protein [Snodgrassella communis]|jgi:hypothetical protein|uniref:Phage tail protein n=3 Tax=Snodgrassella communis TaxID=2946699 RepID=A0A836Z2S4_9NEIS|nr:phage tail protein [Snodgrassella communis]PIT51885.1 phage tail protein [Snodgrassella alvi]KDN14047.1 hypothetical protein SALWKB29_1949 [Snodgrassella communis]PIT10728.1 phage tail protein [Snodgrassella communis]PIT23965.1 phage tail protein [Snodgrassella communis]PIT24075.1 phage tail protein [Snodgrassella communis]
MAAQLPDGSKLYIEKGRDTPISITSISNANPAVATAANHTLATGDYIELVSGWSGITMRIVRVGKVTKDTFELEGINTSKVEDFPVGGGKGSARKILERVQITQVLEFNTSGGEQQYATFQFLEDNFERKLPTITSAQSIDLGIADDPTLDGYKALKEAKDNRGNYAVFLELCSGSTIAYNAAVSLNETPKVNKGNVMQINANLSLQALPMRY